MKIFKHRIIKAIKRMREDDGYWAYIEHLYWGNWPDREWYMCIMIDSGITNIAEKYGWEDVEEIVQEAFDEDKRNYGEGVRSWLGDEAEKNWILQNT